MEQMPRSYDRVLELIKRGVDIPNPLTLDIGEEVDPNRISGKNVRIYPGCRIYGSQTVISRGSRLGYEGPVTIDNCQLGPDVELKAGFFSKSVFLAKANMGLGAQVREGCILEEEANGAHCVGLKQTILFPFVTLGSLINFCDCLMAGGTSRKNHSEVGSSYIHFNYTPDGDKATPSLIGDVPRGVMLNQRPIFLGGQGGMVGPARMGYGNVVAAGSVLRNDILEDNRLVVGKTHHGKVVEFMARSFPNLTRIVRNNIIYLANLKALEQWYLQVRRPFFEAQEMGSLVYEGALDKIGLAKKERIKRLEALAEMTIARTGNGNAAVQELAGGREFSERFYRIHDVFSEALGSEVVDRHKNDFLSSFEKLRGKAPSDYISSIQALPSSVSGLGTSWLQTLVEAYTLKAQEVLPSLPLFERT
ncbi:MAG TPA: UDP-N-acetylglucosamine pyrophosphorylase [Deltaproteobacteria bacterium]|nr:UDP-N-acetylglucosamine pyrophosphorylase [Deltaproteobacteria bacterium]